MNHSIIVAAIAIMLCAGCERDRGNSASAGDTAEGAGTAAVPAAPEPAATQRVLNWDCDGGVGLTTKDLPRDGAISLRLHEGERKLPRVPAASGEKYQDGPLTFWRKGGTAIYERTPTPPIDCRLAS